MTLPPDYTGAQLEAFINAGGSLVSEPVVINPTIVSPKPYIEVAPQQRQQRESEPTPQKEEPSVVNPTTEEDEPEGGYNILLPFPNPALFLAFFNKDIADGHTCLHQWQREVNQDLAPSIIPTSQNPLKYYLVAANGSGKDAFVIAPFAVWFIFCKIKSRVILTSSSGQQLASQSETYIKLLCERVNTFFNAPVFRIRQRYIRCNATGSEIRMFATDEAGKAEGYHPIEPGAEMAIIKNESKSIAEDIHKALRRCSGFNYWLEVSSPGQPQGAFYRATTRWTTGRRVTSFDCPHISDAEREEDKIELGESSSEYRSKHLALFTSSDSDVVIPSAVIEDTINNPPLVQHKKWQKRIGIDLAAGGDETALCMCIGTSAVKEKSFREKNTLVTTDIIERWLIDNTIPKDHDFIFADDGGIGHAIIDNLVERGWNINRIRNESRAMNNRRFGNRGAELWFNVKTIFENRIFNIHNLSQVTIDQLGTRKYKQVEGGRMFLQSKRSAKADGFPSPDRADAFVLSFTGLTVFDFLDATVVEVDTVKLRLNTPDEVEAYYDKLAYGDIENKQRPTTKKARGSLQIALSSQYGQQN